MWTSKNRAHYKRDHLRYPSDVTDEEWAHIEPLIPPAKRGGRKREVDARDVVDGIIMYVLSTGCQWRYIPKDLPPRCTVYRYFCLWGYDGTLDRIRGRVRGRARCLRWHLVGPHRVMTICRWPRWRNAHADSQNPLRCERWGQNAAPLSGCSATLRSTVPSPPDTISSPRASSACYSSPQLVTGSNLSTRPRSGIDWSPQLLHHGCYPAPPDRAGRRDCEPIISEGRPQRSLFT